MDCGYHPINSIIVVDDEVWAASGPNVNIITVLTYNDGIDMKYKLSKVRKRWK